MKKKISTLMMIAATVLLSSIANAQTWNLVGNSTATAASKLGTTNNIPLRLFTNNVEQIHINANVAGKVGFVGLGTTAPNTRLQVNGVITATSGTSTNWNTAYTRVASAYTTGRVPRWNGTAFINGSIFDNGTRVGIGTTAPTSKLHVVGTDYATLTAPGYLMLGTVAASNLAMDINVIQARYNGTAAALYLNYYGGYTYLGPSAAVAINSAGNMTTGYPVGINGNYDASYALNVNASTSYNGINVTDGGNAYSFNSTKSGLLAGVFVTKTSTTSTDACIWGNSTGSSYGVRGSSNTGFGVYGTTNSGSYAGYFAGNVYSTGTYQGSDLKLKKDVRDFSKALDIINQLQPKIYQYKHDGDYKLMNLPDGDRYGLIAQDLEKVLPGLVKQTTFETATDEDIMKGTASPAIDFKAVNYTELIPILIKGMQEQQAVITKQQQQLDQLMQMAQSTPNASNASGEKTTANESDAYLMQNAPNPFTQNTTVRYYVPTSVKQAELVVYNENGNIMKSYILTNGHNEVIINAGTLSSGQYTYVLLADGKKVDSRNMTLTK